LEDSQHRGEIVKLCVGNQDVVAFDNIAIRQIVI